MVKLMAFYRQSKEQFLNVNRRCELYNAHTATEIHHSRGRAGTLLLDERFWKGTCASAHDFIHSNPALAREYGLICKHGDWNNAPKDEETARLKQLMKDLTK